MQRKPAAARQAGARIAPAPAQAGLRTVMAPQAGRPTVMASQAGRNAVMALQMVMKTVTAPARRRGTHTTSRARHTRPPVRAASATPTLTLPLQPQTKPYCASQRCIPCPTPPPLTSLRGCRQRLVTCAPAPRALVLQSSMPWKPCTARWSGIRRRRQTRSSEHPKRSPLGALVLAGGLSDQVQRLQARRGPAAARRA